MRQKQQLLSSQRLRRMLRQDPALVQLLQQMNACPDEGEKRQCYMQAIQHHTKFVEFVGLVMDKVKE
jgi:hypothetical protein